MAGSLPAALGLLALAPIPTLSAGILASPGAPAPDESLAAAVGLVFSAETDTHVLMGSSQAALQRMQWSFNRWGLAGHKKTAAQLFGRLTAQIERYRLLTQKTMTATDPIAARRNAALNAPRTQKAAETIPDKIGTQLEEIFKMRREYDADANRSALIRARASLKKIELKANRPSYLKPAQQSVLASAYAIASTIDEAADSVSKSLPPESKDSSGAHRRGRQLVSEEILMLKTDSTDLRTDIARLEIHYRLNNFLTDGAPRP